MNKKILVTSIILFLVLIVYGYNTFIKKIAKPLNPSDYTSVGVSNTEILIGSSAALSGPALSLGQNLISGARVAINEINDAGGIHGRKLRMISYDDQYDPPKAIENTQRLINEDKVFALFNYVGTPTGVKVMPLLEEARIPLVGMFTGAEIFRKPFHKYIFNIRGSYYQETELAVRYFFDDRKFKNIAVFYQADAFGMAGLEGVKIALAKRSSDVSTLATYERSTLNVEEAANIIGSSNAEAVIMIGTYSPLAKFVGLVKNNKPNMLFHTVSFVGPEAFENELKGNNDNVYVTQVVPPIYYGTLFDGVKAYTRSLKKYEPNTTPTFGGLEGYINTKVLAEGIRLAGRELTREGLVEALESFTNYDLGIGATLSYTSENHYGLDKAYLTSFDKGQFVLIPVN